MMNPTQLLQKWLESRLPADARAWLVEATSKLRSGSDTDLYRSVSLVTRKVGKADLDLSADERRQATAAREGWDPSDWSLDRKSVV